MKHGGHTNNTLAAKASRALGWNFVNTVLSRLGTLGISIMLARLLGPHVFGAYAVALVALYAMQTFNELGMSLAIVRWETDPCDIIPTITTVSVAISVVTYAACFWIAPAYASAMGAPGASGVVQVLALAIVIDGFCNTPAGLLQRRFQQGKATIAQQVGSWTGVGVTVALALSNYGAMSLAIGQVAGSLVVAIFLIVFAPESLRFGFDPARARALLHFGLPLSGSNLISFGVMSVDQIIVGHMLGPTSLAFYVLAFNLSSWPYNMFLGPVRNVAPAVFSRLQHDQPTMRSTFLSAARILTAVTLPICLLIGGSATALIGFVYGARWLPAAQPLIWLAVVGGARIFLQLAYDYLVVLGWTRLLLIIQLVWLSALIPCLIGATRADGIHGAALAEAAVALLVVLPCYLAALWKAGIGPIALGKSLLLPLTAAAAAGLAAMGASMLAPSNFIALAVSGVITTALVGLIAYRMRSTFAGLKRVSATPRQLPVPQVESVVQDPEPPPAAPSHEVQVVIGDIPREPPGFQPRAELMAELDRTGDGVSVIHPVTGMSGVGATQLAAAYARAKLAAGWRLVVWVDAHDTGSLMTGLAAAAEAPGLFVSDSWRDTADAGRTVRLRLRLEADGDRCLLVFNDAEDLDMLWPFIPVGGTARVLVTSTRPPAADLGTSIPVGVLSADEAVTFLAGRTGLADETGAAAVAAELGHLPLALALAAAEIAGQNLGYGAYLDRLRATPARVPPGQEEGRPSCRGTADAVLLSLNAIRTADKTGLCTRVMETLAVLSTAGVRRELLLARGQQGELIIGQHRVTAARVDRALAQLAERSLLTCSLDGRTVVAHPLVTQVVRAEITRHKRLTAVGRTAAAMLEAHAQSFGASRDRLAIRHITEQVTALAKYTAATAGETDEELTRALLRLRFLALYHLIELGDSATQAVAFSEQLTGDLERALGPDHPGTLNSRNSLAAAYRAAGRANDAIQLFQQILVSRMRLLGPEHPDTQMSQNNLAAAYHDAGRLVEAILLYELTLAARERLLGASHPSTLNSRGNLAAAYQDAGRIDDAIPLFEQILAARERLLGADNSSTVNSRVALAAAYRDAGRAADAIPLMEQVLATRERLLGTDYAKTLAARNNLAAVYMDAGRTADAIPLLEQTLAVRERLLGTDHPSTLASRNNLANAYRDAGRADEAIPQYEQTLAACERLLGGDHRKTLASRANLANAYRDAGRADEAIPLFEQTLADRERLVGTDYPDTRTMRSNLTLAYQEE